MAKPVDPLAIEFLKILIQKETIDFYPPSPYEFRVGEPVGWSEHPL